jgi:hypothetical protein
MHSNREDIPVAFQSGFMCIREIEWGEMDGDFWTLSAGFDATPLFKGLPNGCEFSLEDNKIQ